MSRRQDDLDNAGLDDVSPDEFPYGDPATRERPLILLADDDPELRGMLKAHFATKDCDVIEGIDGADTLEQILVHHPNLVVLDVMMPELTGWEICKYVKERAESFQHTGILMLTGIGPLNNELTSPLFGADDYIDKPFEFSELEFKVRKVLSDKKRA
ncbi:MAG: response regulator [Bradymonadaceae bacterium]|nr:response regulator [Lujinxingiaceae bacterium]